MAGPFLSALPVRPRTAMALALLVMVGMVILIGRLVGGEPQRGFPDGSSQLSTIDPSTGNDSVVNLDPSPTLNQPTVGKDAVAVAAAFAENWIDKDRSAVSWRSSLKPLSTNTLTDELAGADPISVPAQRIAGQATIEILAEESADFIFPTDAGKLRLRLVLAPEGRWLVDGIDWERA